VGRKGQDLRRRRKADSKAVEEVGRGVEEEGEVGKENRESRGSLSPPHDFSLHSMSSALRATKKYGVLEFI
jgi:hypothetical protein